ncbi:cytochrome P450 [Striga asiatica]|uniref:Cytochrome P450 n=1 Tax=Striga asiatica TaxID=4170 RepID=A0A5A7QCV3_STRAF|nr:cytochrome P450 [Striga asiatica]
MVVDGGLGVEYIDERQEGGAARVFVRADAGLTCDRSEWQSPERGTTTKLGGHRFGPLTRFLGSVEYRFGPRSSLRVGLSDPVIGGDFDGSDFGVHQRRCEGQRVAHNEISGVRVRIRNRVYI